MYLAVSNITDAGNFFISQFTQDSSETLGVQVLKSRGFFAHEYWYWLGLGALFGFVLLLNFAYTLALTFLDRGLLLPSLLS